MFEYVSKETISFSREAKNKAGNNKSNNIILTTYKFFSVMILFSLKFTIHAQKKTQKKKNITNIF